MKKTLLALGCSHVAGCEITDPQRRLEEFRQGKISMEDLDLDNRPLSFANRMAEFLGWHCENLSMSGASNDRSLRLLIRSLQSQPFDLVIFGYTCADRREFYYPDSRGLWGQDRDGYLQVGLQFTEEVEEIIGYSHPINQLYVEHILRADDQRVQDLHWTVETICQKLSVPVMHLAMVPGLPTLTPQFDFEGHGNYIDWAQSRGFKPSPNRHYGRDAHLALASLLLTRLV